MEEFDPLEELAAAVAPADTDPVHQSVVNVIRSYHNATDVLAEPIQNAADELDAARDLDPSLEAVVEVRIDASTNTIEISDNGRGIPFGAFKALIAPHRTLKGKRFSEGRSRGHKGVGMTFLAYGFNRFEIESKTDTEHYRYRIEGGRNWVENPHAHDRPRAEARPERRRTMSGTTVRILCDQQSQPSRVSMAYPGMEYCAFLLRSSTAVGQVNPGGFEPAGFECKLTYVDSSGAEHAMDVPTSYLFATTDLPEVLQFKVLDVAELLERYKDSVDIPRKYRKAHKACHMWVSTEKMIEVCSPLGGNHLSAVGEFEAFMRAHKVQAHIVFAYGTKYRDKRMEAFGVPSNRIVGRPGLRIASDGMISSWHREVDLKRAMGNKDRLWITYHFQGVEPDMGRKDFPPEVHDVVEATQQKLAEWFVKEVRDPLLEPAPKGGGKEDLTSEYKQPLRWHIERKRIAYPQLASGATSPLTITEPEEEADVVALFNQMVGSGLMAHMRPSYFSGIHRYDSFFEVDNSRANPDLLDSLPYNEDRSPDKEVTVEFKLLAAALFDDLVNETKRWSDMGLLICWEIGKSETDGDGERLQFTRVDGADQRPYAGVTHLATYDSAGEQVLPVVSLKTLLQTLGG